MPEPGALLRGLTAVLVGLALVRWQLWRALVFLRPTLVGVEAEDPSDGHLEVPPVLEDARGALTELGFRWLGTHSERALAGPTVTFFDAVHPQDLVFASLSVHLARPRLVLVTLGERGFVVTADHRRPARDVAGRYLAGALEGVGPRRLVLAHLRRAAAMGAPLGRPTLEGRVELARRWYAGPGRTDLRLQHAVGALWTLGGLLIVMAGLHGLGAS